MNSNQIFWFKIALLLCLTLLIVLGVALSPPIPQDQSYHNFIDKRVILGIPNFWNVVSNAPFIVVGIMGIQQLTRKARPPILPTVFLVYFSFFLGVALVGFGSAYYHLGPSNKTLVWDRLPMTIAFMSFFTIVISEFISEEIGKLLFLPLLLIGVLSVGYWYLTQLKGNGDLRLYALVQFLPLLLIPLIFLLFSPRFSHISLFWAVLAAYLLAKVAEIGDEVVYRNLGGLSGHTLKHLFAALGPYFFFLALKKRTRHE